MRILGVDPGEVRIGLSISDELASIALPLSTVERTKSLEDAAEAVSAAIASVDISKIVVGLPLRMDGSEGEAARRARLLGAALEAKLEVKVVYWDERLTSAQAQRSLREAEVRISKRRDVVDQAAATLLLQTYLDASAEDLE